MNAQRKPRNPSYGRKQEAPKLIVVEFKPEPVLQSKSRHGVRFVWAGGSIVRVEK